MQAVERKQGKRILLLSLLTSIPASATVAIVNKGDTVFWANIDRNIERGLGKIFEVAGKSIAGVPIALAQGDGDGGDGDGWAPDPCAPLSDCSSCDGDGGSDGGSC